ncbi:hypothetical protein AMATHDRAFT_54465 [Amanita thiersii Skay4041]|uniref:Uncharacterized protein n=1 Tax=Amanita thiersii Skay4041 TaxID=703135 RepID=A0A2A9NZD2_9AGAR|nr:hypothetical protein AMATHDRAFT_54465 [Amanita thiersii Skay4041]
MSTPDDLPWPELGNVSRGATRGNQGQKGVLGPPDSEGRCLLQLRVQPGVLCVLLNRKSSEWYRILDNEVNRALKLTKTYWRKARRRQDYDARADQDHMELHEWLQQLKDKTMSHLELLMQKGDIHGPPYIMPTDMELTFLRKFIERQAAGIPHNPRLRYSLEGEYTHADMSVGSLTPNSSDHSYLQRGTNDIGQNLDQSNGYFSRSLGSPLLQNGDSLTQEAAASKQALQGARMSLIRAQKDTQEAFMRYTTCLDIERQARMAVTAAEKRRDDVMAQLLARNQSDTSRSRNSSFSGDDRRSPPRYPTEADVRNTTTDFFNHTRMKNTWPDPDSHAVYTNESTTHMEDQARVRKHTRSWDHPSQLPGLENQYPCENMASLPPRKRIHHMMSGFDVLGPTAPLHPQNMTLPS